MNETNITEAFDASIKQYLNFKNKPESPEFNSFFVIVIRLLCVIYDELDIINPYLMHDEKAFDMNLCKYGFELDKVLDFKVQFDQAYLLELKHEANSYFINIQKVLIDMFMYRKEKIDLDEYGIIHNSCIDKELIEKIIGCKLKINKDKNQRIECGCVESVEVGTYNTCKNGCVYCYANYSAKSVESNFQKYDPLSPLLCGHIEKDDKISTRKVVSLKETQISIFDI